MFKHSNDFSGKKKSSFPMNFLLLTHSNTIGRCVCGDRQVYRVRICSNEPGYQHGWRFCPGHVTAPPLGSIRDIVAVYVCRKVLSTATRVGSKQDADPQEVDKKKLCAD